jgi:hypothetical protein
MLADNDSSVKVSNSDLVEIPNDHFVKGPINNSIEIQDDHPVKGPSVNLVEISYDHPPRSINPIVGSHRIQQKVERNFMQYDKIR